MTVPISKDNSLLLVIDIQETLFKVCLDRERVERNAVKLIEAAKALGLPVIATEQYPKGLGPTSDAIAKALGPVERTPKTSFSCFGEPGLGERLEKTGRDQVIVCGIEAHICVYQTARDLAARGRPVHVAGDAITSRGEFDFRVALDRMREEGIKVSSTEMIIYDLLGRSGTEEFQRLLPLLKQR